MPGDKGRGLRRRSSVLDFMVRLLPFAERYVTTGKNNLFHLDDPLVLRQVELFEDKFIVEPDFRRRFFCTGVIDSFWPGPIDSSHAHRTRLAARINLTVRQLEVIQISARPANGLNFGMGCRIVRRRHLVPSYTDDFLIFDDNGAKRSAVIAVHIFSGQLDYPLNERFLFQQYVQIPSPLVSERCR